MNIRCLGHLEVVVEGSPADLGGSQQRHVLATLISCIGSPLTTDAIVDDLWGERPPDTARKTVQGYISALRRILPDDTITSTPTGYALTVDPETIDRAVFESLNAMATALPTDEAEQAARLFREALALWRGAPYDGIAESDLLRPEIIRLEELQLSMIEGVAAADIFAGREGAAVADLADLTRRHPLRERLWALRILALYRTGRQTEALRVFDEARRTLVTEAGLEPSHELRTLEQRVLNQDPVLDGYGALDATVELAQITRRNPYKGLRAFDEADASDFYGRNALVRRLVETVTARGAHPLHFVAGPSGSGKSSLVRAGLVPALRQAGRKIEVSFPEDGLPDGLAGAGSDNVLVIDQFEELFAGDDDVAVRSYLATLTDLIEGADPPIVVVTVRADRLDRLLSNERIAEHIERSLFLVTPLEDHEVREIVTGPARCVGLTVVPALVASVVSGARGHTASL
ncbi:MAG: BTAD domain-containing putative transcriptional regulator, partial [Acidimicrobiia bacterium]